MHTRLHLRSLILLITLLLHAQAAPAQQNERPAQLGNPLLQPIMTVFGEGYETYLGANTLALGDINRDGWPDFAVGSFGTNELRIYLGGPGILDSIADLILLGGINAVRADINGDGIRDIVSIHFDGRFTSTAIFYLGRTDQPLQYSIQPDFCFSPDYEGELGIFIDAGDLNGDGYDDVVIADCLGGEHVNPGSISGVVYIFMGSAVPDTIPCYILNMAEWYYYGFGWDAQVGDVNGDGYDDVALGRWFARYGPPDNIFNQKLLWFGGADFSPVDGKPDQVFESNNIPGALRRGYLTDVDNDGMDDLVFPNDSKGNVLFGTPSGLASFVGRILPAIGGLGWDGIARLEHDITGDKIRDYVICASLFDEHILAYFKGSNTGIASSEFAFSGASFAYHRYGDLTFHRVCSVGDVNGDGRNDVLASDRDSPGCRGFFHILSGIGPPLSAEREGIAPSSLSLSSIRPNPSTGPVAMDLITPAAARARVSVHDALGREIRMLTDAVYGPGTHTLTWNGRDAVGAPVPQGVYLLRATSGAQAVTARVVIGSPPAR